MDRWNASLFRAAALASGLVTHEQLDEAIATIRVASLSDENTGDDANPKDVGQSDAARPNAARPNAPSPDVGRPDADRGAAATADFSDDELAEKLVEMGRLNRWQAEQLKAGRTKFQLGDYQIIDSIGQGGMGQVFKAVHTLLGRVEAVKVLPRVKSSPESITSFRHEIRAHAQLDHPSLVRVSYAGFDGNVYYLVTEYVPGADLRKLVRANGPLRMDQAAAIIAEAAEGLAYVHQCGLIHRDVKPGNLLVTPDGRTKVSDLGLAGFTTAGGDEDPRAGKIVGTSDYLAPEQILTPREVTPAVDIYALGCTLYYAVTGKVPYPGGTAKEKARRHCNDTPLHPRHLNPLLSDAFVELIGDMMEKNPRQRIQTAVDVIQRLGPWLAAPAELRMAVTQSAKTATESRSAEADEFELVETDSEVFDFPAAEPGPQDSASQASQGTVARAATTEETATEVTATVETTAESAAEVMASNVPVAHHVPPLPSPTEKSVEIRATAMPVSPTSGSPSSIPPSSTPPSSTQPSSTPLPLLDASSDGVAEDAVAPDGLFRADRSVGTRGKRSRSRRPVRLFGWVKPCVAASQNAGRASLVVARTAARAIWRWLSGIRLPSLPKVHVPLPLLITLGISVAVAAIVVGLLFAYLY